MFQIFRRKKRESEPEVPKVWVTINGMPFYISVTDPFVELAYGIDGARFLRELHGIVQ